MDDFEGMSFVPLHGKYTVRIRTEVPLVVDDRIENNSVLNPSKKLDSTDKRRASKLPSTMKQRKPQQRRSEFRLSFILIQRC